MSKVRDYREERKRKRGRREIEERKWFLIWQFDAVATMRLPITDSFEVANRPTSAHAVDPYVRT
jgi:hypothetical protein